MTTMEREYAQLYFARVGVEYYVAGRFSWACHNLLTTGVLFHHATEMFLKSKLVDKFSLDELKKPRLGHNLLALWSEFKDVCSDASLTKYDTTIQRLNKWEDLRYPPQQRGAIGLSLDMRTGDKSGVTYPTTTAAEQYTVNLEDVDELVTTLFSVLSLNPKFFGEFTRGEAERIYVMENRHAMEVK